MKWRRVDPKNKEPFSFRMADDAPFAFAFMASDLQPTADPISYRAAIAVS